MNRPINPRVFLILERVSVVLAPVAVMGLYQSNQPVFLLAIAVCAALSAVCGELYVCAANVEKRRDLHALRTFLLVAIAMITVGGYFYVVFQQAAPDVLGAAFAFKAV